MEVPAGLPSRVPSQLPHATAYSAQHLQCDLLCTSYGLSLALFARQFSSVADDLLSLSAILTQGHLGTPPPSPTSGGTLPGGQRSPPKRGHYGCPVGQDGRGIGPHQWVRRTQARQG